MGLSGVVFPKATSFSGAEIDVRSSNQSLPTPLRFSGRKARIDLRSTRAFGSAGDGLPKMEKSLGDMTMKKKLKLLKRLLCEKFSKSVSGHGGVGLVSEVKERMVSEAAEVLIKQLQHVKVKEETKRNKKMEATKMKESSPSSSSSSSDTDSDNEEVINKSQLRIKPHDEHIPAAGSPTLSDNDVKKRIEVCTGKKCRKAGGEALMGELERAIGGEGEVVGSKCMGKCKDGPNVRVVDSQCGGKVLCIGVGVEDVDAIVNSYRQSDSGIVSGSS